MVPEHYWPDGLEGATSIPTAPFLEIRQKHGKINFNALLSLEDDPRVQLHPRPTAAECAYPCFMHEIDTPLNGLRSVSNRLASSLAFALDQQEELRRLAGIPEADRLPVFGAASFGAVARLYCGEYVGDVIVSLLCQPHHTRPGMLIIHLRVTAYCQLEAHHASGLADSRQRLARFFKGSKKVDVVYIRRHDQSLARSCMGSDNRWLWSLRLWG